MALKKSQRSLRAWTKQEWGTKSGKKSSETGERYLPKAARDALTPAEYAATTAKKRKDTAAGKQVSKQPEKIAKKTRSARQFRSVGGPIKLQVLGGLAEDAQDKIGSALYPVACDKNTVSLPSLILLTIIDSGLATKSIPTTDKSITIVAAPTVFVTGS